MVVEQLKHSILFPFGFAPNFPDVFILLESCKGAQIDKYLKPFLRGETQSCIAITEPSRAEPGADADASGIQMRAERMSGGKSGGNNGGNNGRWILHGNINFITHARYADFMIVVTLTDPAKGSRGGMTTFLLDAKQPGITVPTGHPTIGDYQPYDIHFDNVVATDDQVLGENDDERWQQAYETQLRGAVRVVGKVAPRLGPHRRHHPGIGQAADGQARIIHGVSRRPHRLSAPPGE